MQLDQKELKGTKTEQNIKAAFAGESQARNKYTYYSSKAKEEGNEQTAELFDKMADNEREHAKIWYKILNGIGGTKENVQDAAQGESYEWRTMYPEFAQDAREEGFEMLASMFEKIAAIEQTHEERFLKEFVRLQSSGAPAAAQPVEKKPVYRCEFCGYTEPVEKGEPPVVCPVCEAIGAFVKTLM